jgi:hypothetical protein
VKLTEELAAVERSQGDRKEGRQQNVNESAFKRALEYMEECGMITRK